MAGAYRCVVVERDDQGKIILGDNAYSCSYVETHGCDCCSERIPLGSRELEFHIEKLRKDLRETEDLLVEIKKQEKEGSDG